MNTDTNINKNSASVTIDDHGNILLSNNNEEFKYMDFIKILVGVFELDPVNGSPLSSMTRYDNNLYNRGFILASTSYISDRKNTYYTKDYIKDISIPNSQVEHMHLSINFCLEGHGMGRFYNARVHISSIPFIPTYLCSIYYPGTSIEIPLNDKRTYYDEHTAAFIANDFLRIMESRFNLKFNLYPLEYYSTNPPILEFYHHSDYANQVIVDKTDWKPQIEDDPDYNVIAITRYDQETIIEFIKRRFPNPDMWRTGNCYWFAKILAERFYLDIYYMPIMGHFVCSYGDGTFFDQTGIIDTKNEPTISLAEIKNTDPAWYARLVRDCIE